MKVLIADDDSALRLILERVLTDWGHEVQTTGDGAEALAMVENDPCLEVLILDWMMPGISGIDICRHLRTLDRDHYTYVILVTSRSGKDSFIEGMSSGVDDFVPKPIDHEELRARMYAAERIIKLKTEVQVEKAVSRHLQELDRMKTAFINLTSHELRSPLSIVNLMLDLLDAHIPADNEEMHSLLKSTTKSTARLTRITQETLKVCQEGNYEKRLNIENTDPAVLAQEAIDEVLPFAGIRRQNIQLEAAPGMPPVALDADKIKDVLINLLMNAIRFTPDKKTITVSVAPNGSDKALFSVADPGIGIPEEDKPHVFEACFSSMDIMHHSSGQYEFGTHGIGLGLTIVKNFVEMHGGTVGFESEPGHGSRFYFELPFQQRDTVQVWSPLEPA